MLIILVVVALAGGGVIYYLMQSGKKDSEPTIDEILNNSVDVAEITTNLAGNDYIKISFKIQTDGKKAKEELTKRDFQVRNIIIEELSDKKAEELQSKKGKILFENSLQTKINALMQEGKIVKVYITESLLQ